MTIRTNTRAAHIAKITCTILLLALPALTQERELIPTFDAASIKIVAEDGRGFMRGGPGTSDPGRVVWAGAEMRDLLTRAWGIDYDRLVGPDWIHRPTLYRLEATMPSDTTMARFQAMLQNLLIERFNLKVHHETRRYPGYKLVVAPGGPKLKPSVSHASPPPLSVGPVDSQGCPIIRNGRHSFAAQARSGAVCITYEDVSMTDFSQDFNLLGSARLPDGSIGHIVDETGLSEHYDFKLRFDNSTNTRPPVIGPRVGEAVTRDEVGSGLPGVFSALEKQLGLRLQKAAAIPMDTIVVDAGNPVPTEN